MALENSNQLYRFMTYDEYVDTRVEKEDPVVLEKDYYYYLQTVDQLVVAVDSVYIRPKR